MKTWPEAELPGGGPQQGRDWATSPVVNWSKLCSRRDQGSAGHTWAPLFQVVLSPSAVRRRVGQAGAGPHCLGRGVRGSHLPGLHSLLPARGPPLRSMALPDGPASGLLVRGQLLVCEPLIGILLLSMGAPPGTAWGSLPLFCQ